jgi:hypothetical protein
VGGGHDVAVGDDAAPAQELRVVDPPFCNLCTRPAPHSSRYSRLYPSSAIHGNCPKSAFFPPLILSAVITKPHFTGNSDVFLFSSVVPLG